MVAAARVNDASLSIVDCQSLDRTHMAMTLEIAGTSDSVQKTIATLRTMIGVGHAYELEGDFPATRVIITLEKPRICQTSDDRSVLCADCPFDTAEIPVKWRLTLRQTGDTGQFVAKLAEEEIQAATDGLSPVDKGMYLTPRERGIFAVAIERGYFEFPRRITLEGLSQLVGVDVSRLSKLFHSLE